MTQIHEHSAHVRIQPNHRSQPCPHADGSADEILRDIAFVLKLTQRVRHEIEAEKQVDQPVLANA
ncbi:MAG: hypothetical protein FJ303_25010 [Planctomycetes bacterium]|nr:hypothetical protein [Planctomycetota bacterium]